MYMRTIEYVLCVFWHRNIFSSHLHLQINQKASPKSVQKEVCPFLNTESHIWENGSTVINQATALSKHVYLKNNCHLANTITCVLNTNLATYLLMNGESGKGCCSCQLKRWFSFKNTFELWMSMCDMFGFRNSSKQLPPYGFQSEHF